MAQTPRRGRTGEDDRALDEAVASLRGWARADKLITGLWLDRRHLKIGVAIIAADELGTKQAIQKLVAPPIEVLTEVAPTSYTAQRQLQIDVSNYLDDEQISGRWVVQLGVNDQRVVLIGLLHGTPDNVPAQVRAHYPGVSFEFYTTTRPILV